MIFIFLRRTNYFSTVSIHSTNFDTSYLLLLYQPSPHNDVNVKIARRTSILLSLSLSLSRFAARKSKRQRGRTVSSFVRYAGKSALCAVFYARTHNTPVSVYRKQVLSIRRGKINKWRSWCSPGPGCLPLSSSAYRVFTSVKTGSVNMHVLCINTERSPMLLLLLLSFSLSLSFFPSSLSPTSSPCSRASGTCGCGRKGREKGEFSRGEKRCEYVGIYMREVGRGLLCLIQDFACRFAIQNR